MALCMSGVDKFIVWKAGDYNIFIVDRYSPIYLKRLALDADYIASKDTNIKPENNYSSFNDGRNAHFFLLQHKNNVVGLLSIQKRKYLFTIFLKNEETVEYDKNLENKIIWSVSFIWVDKEIRGNGFGKDLIKSAIAYLGIKLYDLGWTEIISESGKVFVKRISKDEIIFVK